MTETTQHIEQNTNDFISITLDGKTYNISVELMQGYYDQAAEFLSKIDRATDGFKAEVDALAETTDLPKGFVGKLFKAKYADKVAAETAKADALSTLAEAISKGF